MEAVEFCEMRHGYCACRKAGEVHCLQILRLVEDPVEIEKAQAERDAADRKRRSKYIVDEPAPRRGLMDHQIEMIRAAMTMRPEMTMPRIPGREEMFRRMYGGGPVASKTTKWTFLGVDLSEVEKRVLSREEFTRNPIYEELEPYPTPAERRLGSSEKDYVKFHYDPMKRRPS